MTNPVLENIRTRRIITLMTDEPVDRAQLEQVLEAARWAPSAGNRRPHRFVVVRDQATLRVLRMVSPGMFQRPPVVIVICIDRDEGDISSRDLSVYYDAGTGAENMMLAAHSMGLGAGVVTSFSKEAVRVVLNLPERLSPHMFVCVGHRASDKAPGVQSSRRITWESLTFWERFSSSP